MMKCPSCSSGEIDLHISTFNFRNRSDRNIYNYYICRKCNLIFLDSSKNEGKNHYSDDYHSYFGLREKNVIKTWLNNLGLKKRLKIVYKHKLNGNLLDIGCATGEFLKNLSLNGNWKLYGIEPNTSARKKTENETDIQTFPDLFEARFPSDYFDIVTMWDVIEHISNPNELLIEINRILRVSGVLIIKTPDISSPEARFFEKFWSGLEAPWHLFLLSKTSIEKLLIKNKFANFRYYQPNIDYSTFSNSLLNYFFLNNTSILKVVRTLLFRYPFKLIFNFFLRIIRILGFTSSLTVSAKKIK